MGAVSKVITGSANDVLAGTVLGVLPSDAPSYSVEIAAFSDTFPVSGGTTTITVLVNGVAILERSIVYREQDYIIATGSSEAGKLGKGLFSSDAPLCIFDAPAGSRLTVNVQGGAVGRKVFLYASAIPQATAAPVSLPLGHVGQFNANLASNPISELDVLQGTPVGSLPVSADVWNVSLWAALVITATDAPADANAQDQNITFLSDSDTICENFILPVRSFRDYPNQERDLMITEFVAGGSRLTLNVFKPTLAGQSAVILYQVIATPI